MFWSAVKRKFKKSKYHVYCEFSEEKLSIQQSLLQFNELDNLKDVCCLLTRMNTSSQQTRSTPRQLLVGMYRMLQIMTITSIVSSEIN